MRRYLTGSRMALLLTCLTLSGCGGNGEPNLPVSDGNQPATDPALQEASNAGLNAVPQVPLKRCRVYTSEPGFSVFVDSYPVRDAAGEILRTPCLIEAAAGMHAITIARAGLIDQTRQVQFVDDAQVVFETASANEGTSAMLAAQYLNMAVGTAIPLNSLNTRGREFDPFVTADGRSLWFAGDRSEGRGVYVAMRPSPLHAFDPPVFLRLTGSADQAASPSVTADELSVVYAVSTKARLRALTRRTPLDEFDQPVILANEEALDVRYAAAQVLAHGDRIYFTRVAPGLKETRVVFETASGDPPYGTPRVVQFPGSHPVLSPDGLRQYLFDGSSVKRAQRRSTNDTFSDPVEIAKVNLPTYKPSAEYRQYFVSNDEQWLFYSDDPFAAGDLWMVRLHNGPAWGGGLKGSTIEPLKIAAAEPMPRMREGDLPFEPMPMTPMPPMPATPAPPPVDPRTLPLPYLAYRSGLLELTTGRDWGKAIDFIDEAQGSQELRPAAELVEWDRQELQELLVLQSEIEQAFQTIPKGASIRLGSVRVDFEKYEAGVIHAKSKTRDVVRPISDLKSDELLNLMDNYLKQNDADVSRRTALLLMYAGAGLSDRVKSLLERAGESGKGVLERLAGREGRLAELEIARGNFDSGFARIEAISTQFPDSKAATSVRELRDKLFTSTTWRKVGKRRWTEGPLGLYAAGPEREDGSLLLSPEMIGDFTLQMEYMTTDPVGQGGVYFKYTGSGRLDRNALKIHLANDAGINPDPFCTGSLFSIDAPKSNRALTQGEWNKFSMTLRGDEIRISINGEEVLKTKFSTTNRPERGHVALDGVLGGITYRKVILAAD